MLADERLQLPHHRCVLALLARRDAPAAPPTAPVAEDCRAPPGGLRRPPQATPRLGIRSPSAPYRSTLAPDAHPAPSCDQRRVGPPLTAIDCFSTSTAHGSQR